MDSTKKSNEQDIAKIWRLFANHENSSPAQTYTRLTKQTRQRHIKPFIDRGNQINIQSIKLTNQATNQTRPPTDTHNKTTKNHADQTTHTRQNSNTNSNSQVIQTKRNNRNNTNHSQPTNHPTTETNK